MYCPVQTAAKFLFFPVLRRGSGKVFLRHIRERFYSSPSCDGDQRSDARRVTLSVSILPRLATGIRLQRVQSIHITVSILPRLATGIQCLFVFYFFRMFLFFPVLRRGSRGWACVRVLELVSILPRLATGISQTWCNHIKGSFYSSPSCDGDQYDLYSLICKEVSILPRLATGIYVSMIRLHILERFYSSPSCDGDLGIIYH